MPRNLSVVVAWWFAAAIVLLSVPYRSGAQGMPNRWLYTPITRVTTVAYSPDGTLLAIAGIAQAGDSGVQIHNMLTGSVRSLATGVNDTINSVAFSPNGSLLAIGGLKHQLAEGQSSPVLSGALELWSVPALRAVASLPTAANALGGGLLVTGGVHAVAFSPDGTTLADGGYSGTAAGPGSAVEIWSVSQRSRIGLLASIADQGVSSVAYSRDGSLLAVGGVRSGAGAGASAGVLEVWNAATQTLAKSLGTGASNGVLSAAFSPDGSALAAGGAGPSGSLLELWSLPSGTLKRSLAAAGLSIHAVAFSPDGSLLADGGLSGTADNSGPVLELWSVGSGSRVRTLAAADVVNSIAFSPDGRTLVDGSQLNHSRYGLVQLWNVSEGSLISAISTTEVGGVQGLVFAPDGRSFAAAAWGTDALGNSFSAVQIRSALTGAVLMSLPSAANDFCYALAFTPDGKMLAVGGEGATDTANGTTYAGVLELWSLTTGKRLATLPTAATGIVNAVAFSPDGRRLASAGANVRGAGFNQAVLEQWSVPSAAPLTSSTDPDLDSIYTAAAFSPDGDTLVVGGYRSAGAILDRWSVAAGKRLGPLETSATGGIYALAFSPDSRTLAVAGDTIFSHSVTLELFDAPAYTPRQTLSPVFGTHRVRSIGFSAGGRFLYFGSDSNLQVFAAATGARLNAYLNTNAQTGPASIAVSQAGLLAYATGFGALGTATAPYTSAFLDLNGDGFTDLLLQNPVSDAIAAWNGGASSAPVSLIPSGYTLAGAGDFSGDGGMALALQSRGDDRVALWRLGGSAGTTVTGGDFTSPNPFAGWRLAGIGDFNGDGKSDLLFQNRTTNQIVIWYMDGAAYTGGASLPYTPPAGWDAVGAGDFNGDGYADIVLQNRSTGQIVIWYMVGVTYVGGEAVTPIPGPAWRVVSVADYNQDGAPDLVFQNRATGQSVVWYLQGTAFQSGALLPPSPMAGWLIAGPH